DLELGLAFERQAVNVEPTFGTGCDRGHLRIRGDVVSRILRHDVRSGDRTPGGVADAPIDGESAIQLHGLALFAAECDDCLDGLADTARRRDFDPGVRGAGRRAAHRHADARVAVRV